MEAEMNRISIARVANGWLISGDSLSTRDFMSREMFVARTPAELCRMVETWAQKQADMPPKEQT